MAIQHRFGKMATLLDAAMITDEVYLDIQVLRKPGFNIPGQLLRRRDLRGPQRSSRSGTLRLWG